MLSCSFQNLNRTLFLTLKNLDILGGTLSIVCLLVNILCFLFFADKLEIALAAPILLHFKLEKRTLSFCFSFVKAVCLFYFLIWSFWKPNTYNVRSLVLERIRKSYCYLSVGTLTSKNITGTLIVLCLSFACLLPCSLTRNCISGSHLVAF